MKEGEHLRRFGLLLFHRVLGQRDDRSDELERMSLTQSTRENESTQYLGVFAWSEIRDDDDAVDEALHNRLVTAVRSKTDESTLRGQHAAWVAKEVGRCFFFLRLSTSFS